MPLAKSLSGEEKVEIGVHVLQWMRGKACGEEIRVVEIEQQIVWRVQRRIRMQLLLGKWKLGGVLVESGKVEAAKGPHMADLWRTAVSRRSNRRVQFVEYDMEVSGKGGGW